MATPERASIVSVLAANPDPNREPGHPEYLVWKVNSPIPLPGEESTKITNMYLIDGIVEVYALPLPNSDLDKMGLGVIIKIFPSSVKTIMYFANFTNWSALVAEAAEAQEFIPDDEDDDEEEEDDSPEEVTQAGNQVTNQAPNGIPAPTLQQIPSPSTNGAPNSA